MVEGKQLTYKVGDPATRTLTGAAKHPVVAQHRTIKQVTVASRRTKDDPAIFLN